MSHSSSVLSLAASQIDPNTHQNVKAALLKNPASDVDTNYGSLSHDSAGIDIHKPDPQVVDIVSRHLVKDSDNLQLKSGDMTRDIYKWTSEHPITASMSNDNLVIQPFAQRRRSISFSGASVHSSALCSTRNSEVDSQYQGEMTHDEIRAPGGFRRSFILQKHKKKFGNDAPPPNFFTNNFIEFLTLYGHFAGQDLEEDDEDEDEIDETEILEHGHRNRHYKEHEHKTSTFKAVLLLLKSFIGTGVLFLPKGFQNGGWGFSVICLFLCAIASFYCFVILVIAKDKVGVNGYGDLGATLYGSKLKFLILLSIALSQIGFSAAYIVFTSANLKVFIETTTGIQKDSIGLATFIIIQALFFIPLAFTRNIAKLSFTTLIADVFILLGLLYVYYYPTYYIIRNGLAKDTMVFFNSSDWSLFIGTAIFTFEGVGLLIPIQESMKHREKFFPCLSGVMIVAAVVFISSGLVCYSAFGNKVETVVLLNFPQDSPFTKAVQLLYAAAILLSTPLQLFPAIRILENWTFPKNASGKYNPRIKWLKNYFRSGVVILTALISYIGANDLDKFVSIVGSFACIPLIYVFPPLLHYKAYKDQRLGMMRSFDLIILTFGLIVMTYTTYQTIAMWGS